MNERPSARTRGDSFPVGPRGRTRELMRMAASKKQDADIGGQRSPGNQQTHSEDGVDLTLIRWMLSLTPAERLQVPQQSIQSLLRPGRAKPMDQSLLSMFDLTGKVAIVTGASRGLGVSFARGLAKAGCEVAIAARSFGQLKQVAGELEIHGKRIVPIKADVCDPHDVEKMVERTLGELGRIDILVNNAGISAVSEAEHMTLERWQTVIDTNLTALFLCAQCVGRHMLSVHAGKIINIASMYGVSASAIVPQASYVASKAGVLGLTRELCMEWAPRGVQVVALVPGFFRSDQTVWAFEENKELGRNLLAKVPMGRLGSLEELEGTIAYLGSSASNYMNGQALILDGGFLAL